MSLLVLRFPKHMLSRYLKGMSPAIQQTCAHSTDNSKDKEIPTESCGTKKRAKTPIGRLDEQEEGPHPFQEKEPLKPWPNATNPFTGEVGGPRGPEPTRFGDWERKGRVSDF